LENLLLVLLLIVFNPTFFEPRLLVVSDPVKDFQPILESSYVNMPVIAMADVDSPTKNIDIVIPCNTRSKNSVALMWWLLSREVLRIRGITPREEEWDVLVDMFLYRDPQNEQNKDNKKQNKVSDFHPDTWKGQADDADDGGDRQGDVNVDEFDQKENPESVGEPGKESGNWENWNENNDEENW